MKAFIVLAVLSAVALGIDGAFEAPEIMKPMIEACRKEFQVTEEELKTKKPLEGNKKCFHFCVAQKIGFMDKDGNLQIETMKKNVGSGVSAEMMAGAEKCAATLKKDDPCAMAEAMCACLHKD